MRSNYFPNSLLYLLFCHVIYVGAMMGRLMSTDCIYKSGLRVHIPYVYEKTEFTRKRIIRLWTGDRCCCSRFTSAVAKVGEVLADLVPTCQKAKLSGLSLYCHRCYFAASASVTIFVGTNDPPRNDGEHY